MLRKLKHVLIRDDLSSAYCVEAKLILELDVEGGIRTVFKKILFEKAEKELIRIFLRYYPSDQHDHHNKLTIFRR